MKIFLRKKFLPGTSMLEVLVAIAVFTIIMVSSVNIFANMTQTRIKFDAIRKNHENAQIAIDSLAKSIRSGVVVSPTTNALSGTSTIRIYDYSQGSAGFEGLCIEYRFDSASLRYRFAPVDRAICTPSYSFGVAASWRTLVSNVTSGSFDVKVNTTTPPSLKMGYVRIRMVLPSHDTTQTTKIQTTVSMRNTK